MDTRPLPIDPATAEVSRDRPPGPVRALEAASGLLGAGVLLVGVVLLAAQLIVPVVITDAVGPGWGRVLPHLLLGAVAESGRPLRRRWPLGVRAVVAGVVIVAAVAVLVYCWWW